MLISVWSAGEEMLGRKIKKGQGIECRYRKEIVILPRINMNDVASEVIFEQMTEMEVMEQAMWAQDKNT